MKSHHTLDITVLANDSPLVIAYLTQIANLGYKPYKIIDLHFEPVNLYYHLLKKMIGKKLAFKCYQIYRKIIHTDSACKELGKIIFKKLGELENIIHSDRHDYHNFCENVEVLYIKNINDMTLFEKIKNENCKTFLYTGGGILKNHFFEMKSCKFIHIHPGIIPFVRGSDGLFWSIATRGKPGTTCFYMNAGIDEGDIIDSMEFEKTQFNFDLKKYTYQQIYSALLYYYDPILRARMLKKVILKSFDTGISMSDQDAVQQKKEEGRTFYFLHESIRNKIIHMMIV